MRIASGIKLRHLEAFLAIARLRSLTDAAADLGVTQPAISKTLKELFVHFGRWRIFIQSC